MFNSKLVDYSDVFSNFILSTYRRQPTDVDATAAIWSGDLATQSSSGQPAAPDIITQVSGSSREFYIKPILTCVGDIDIMFHNSARLAIPAGYPLPTSLPGEFQTRVVVYEITDSKHPGYVYLKTRYILTDTSNDNKYIAEIVDDQEYFAVSQHSADAETHGPATTRHFRISSFDRVYCVRCTVWPPQAKYWPTRSRHYGWPEPDIVDVVVSNGCDVVQVAHRLSKHDEWEHTHQWRLSFSRAEVVLLNTWKPVQQIVYHMLRRFVKTERLADITDNNGEKIFSNYHIKTLMLWQCEQQSKDWWVRNTNVVKICVKLLQTFAAMLNDGRCEHYFISNCNLCASTTGAAKIVNRLNPVTEGWLAEWFLNNYMMKCVQFCPANIARLFDDVSTRTKVQTAVSALVDWRKYTELSDFRQVYEHAKLGLAVNLSLQALECINLSAYVCWRCELTRIDREQNGLNYYFNAIALLHAAMKMAKRTDIGELMLVLSFFEKGLFKFLDVHQQATLNLTELSTPEQIKQLQKSAVEHLTAVRHREAEKFCSLVKIVTTDTEALYAYRCGNYGLSFRLSSENVDELLKMECYTPVGGVWTLSEFIQLLDDDIASLTALTLIVQPDCRRMNVCTEISQLTLSLYLMMQCQLKLHHSAPRLVQTLNCICEAQRRIPTEAVLDHLTLKLARGILFTRRLRPLHRN